MNVTRHLTLVRKAANLTAVQHLEEVLEQARTGEIVSVAIAAVTSDGAARTYKSSAENGVTLLGSVTRLLHQMTRSLASE